jgi:hypothetical protein
MNMHPAGLAEILGPMFAQAMGRLGGGGGYAPGMFGTSLAGAAADLLAPGNPAFQMIAQMYGPEIQKSIFGENMMAGYGGPGSTWNVATRHMELDKYRLNMTLNRSSREQIESYNQQQYEKAMMGKYATQADWERNKSTVLAGRGSDPHYGAINVMTAMGGYSGIGIGIQNAAHAFGYRYGPGRGQRVTNAAAESDMVALTNSLLDDALNRGADYGSLNGREIGDVAADLLLYGPGRRMSGKRRLSSEDSDRLGELRGRRRLSKTESAEKREIEEREAFNEEYNAFGNPLIGPMSIGDAKTRIQRTSRELSSLKDLLGKDVNGIIAQLKDTFGTETTSLYGIERTGKAFNRLRFMGEAAGLDPKTMLPIAQGMAALTKQLTGTSAGALASSQLAGALMASVPRNLPGVNLEELNQTIALKTVGANESDYARTIGAGIVAAGRKGGTRGVAEFKRKLAARMAEGATPSMKDVAALAGVEENQIVFGRDAKAVRDLVAEDPFAGQMTMAYNGNQIMNERRGILRSSLGSAYKDGMEKLQTRELEKKLMAKGVPLLSLGVINRGYEALARRWGVPGANPDDQLAGIIGAAGPAGAALMESERKRAVADKYALAGGGALGMLKELGPAGIFNRSATEALRSFGGVLGKEAASAARGDLEGGDKAVLEQEYKTMATMRDSMAAGGSLRNFIDTGDFSRAAPTRPARGGDSQAGRQAEYMLAAAQSKATAAPGPAAAASVAALAKYKKLLAANGGDGSKVLNMLGDSDHKLVTAAIAAEVELERDVFASPGKTTEAEATAYLTALRDRMPDLSTEEKKLIADMRVDLKTGTTFAEAQAAAQAASPSAASSLAGKSAAFARTIRALNTAPPPVKSTTESALDDWMSSRSGLSNLARTSLAAEDSDWNAKLDALESAADPADKGVVRAMRDAVANRRPDESINETIDGAYFLTRTGRPILDNFKKLNDSLRAAGKVDFDASSIAPNPYLAAETKEAEKKLDRIVKSAGGSAEGHAAAQSMLLDIRGGASANAAFRRLAGVQREALADTERQLGGKGFLFQGGDEPFIGMTPEELDELGAAAAAGNADAQQLKDYVEARLSVRGGLDKMNLSRGSMQKLRADTRAAYARKAGAYGAAANRDIRARVATKMLGDAEAGTDIGGQRFVNMSSDKSSYLEAVNSLSSGNKGKRRNRLGQLEDITWRTFGPGNTIKTHTAAELEPEMRRQVAEAISGEAYFRSGLDSDTEFKKPGDMTYDAREAASKLAYEDIMGNASYESMRAQGRDTAKGGEQAIKGDATGDIFNGAKGDEYRTKIEKAQAAGKWEEVSSLMLEAQAKGALGGGEFLTADQIKEEEQKIKVADDTLRRSSAPDAARKAAQNEKSKAKEKLQQNQEAQDKFKSAAKEIGDANKMSLERMVQKLVEYVSKFMTDGMPVKPAP